MSINSGLRDKTINLANANDKIKVLWISPIHSHYKARFLERLHNRGQIQLTVLSGRMQKEKGFSEAQEQFSYPIERVDVVSIKFGMSLLVAKKILNLCSKNSFDFIMIPADRKRLPLLLLLYLCRPFLGYKLFSYNHAWCGSRIDGRIVGTFNRFLSYLMYAMLDRVVFYTSHERDIALEMKLIKHEKAFYVNNTLDTDEIWGVCPSRPEVVMPPAMLFIGRLVPGKQILLALQYYKVIKKTIPEFRFIIIGDGPDATQVKQVAKEDPDIIWTGMLSQEQQISTWMRQVRFVFNPGNVGLVVVHAFSYGKPLVALREKLGQSDKESLHGPEFWYLRPGENGLLLDGDDIQEDCRQIVYLLTDEDIYQTMVLNARKTAIEISVGRWMEQMTHSLTAKL